MKRIAIGVLLIVTIAVAAFGQQSDFGLNSWGDSVSSVHMWQTATGWRLIEETANSLTYETVDSDGVPAWRSYFFDDGFEAVWLETPTLWRADLGLYEDSSLPRQMSVVTMLTKHEVTRSAEGENWTVWKGDEIVVGSLFIVDNRNHYRIFSFAVEPTFASATFIMDMVVGHTNGREVIRGMIDSLPDEERP